MDDKNDLNHVVESILLPQGPTHLSALDHCKNCVCEYVMNEVSFQFQQSDLKIMERLISLLIFNVYFIPEYMCAHICYICNIACIIWFFLVLCTI